MSVPLSPVDINDAGRARAILRRLLMPDGYLIDRAYNGFRVASGEANLDSNKSLIASRELDPDYDLIVLTVDKLYRDITSVQQGFAIIGAKIRQLAEIYDRTGILPTPLYLESGLLKLELSFAGTESDVWTGEYQEQKVAIKVLRQYTANSEDSDVVAKLRKKFCEELLIWKLLSLDSDNVVPFIGVPRGDRLWMVSKWMPNGTLGKYTKTNPDVDGLQLFINIVDDVRYLHSLQVFHGDLKGDNILVDENGVAQLCDFGFSSIVNTSGCCLSGETSRGTKRWMAPELIDSGELPLGTLITACDVYALGMVAIEIFAGKMPFHRYRHRVIDAIVMKGEKPDRPNSITAPVYDELWTLMESCWDVTAAKRPATPYIHAGLSQIQADLRGVPVSPLQ